MKINKITGVLINILIFIGIVCILCIPLLLKVTIPYYNGVIYYSYMAFLFISGIFTIYILYFFYNSVYCLWLVTMIK